MQVDLGSRDEEFMNAVQEIRQGILSLVNADSSRFHAIPVQGSGTYGVESVLSSAFCSDSKVLFVVNGAYGHRMVSIASRYQVASEVVECEENEVPAADEIDLRLSKGGFSHVAIVHCETTSGILNPIRAIGQVAKKHGCRFIVDAMSSFAAVPIDMEEDGIDFLIASANKCLEGVPGFAFVVVEDDALKQCKDQGRTVTLDLFEQWQVLESTGQFRFTPPTHVFLACRQALHELANEGGVEGRGRRYKSNHETLMSGMRRLGFDHYIAEEYQSYVISTFPYPNDPAFDFEKLYVGLADAGLVIYPGKITKAKTFRIGTIGNVFPEDVARLVEEFERVLNAMGCSTPVNA